MTDLEALAASIDLPTYLEMKKALISETLRRTNGNRTEAAEILRVSIRTVRNWIWEFRLEDEFPANYGMPRKRPVA